MRPDQYSFHKTNTPEQVCNMAAGYLGRYSGSISSLGNEASLQEPARACLLYYDITRRALLEMHTWSFALKEIDLQRYVPKLDESPRLDGSYIKPADIIRIISVGSKQCGCSCECACDLLRNEGYKILESKIIPCRGHWMRYIYNNTHLETWSPMAIKALALFIARETAGAMTMDNDFTNATLINRAFLSTLGEAKKLDNYSRTKRIKYSNRTDDLTYHRAGVLGRRLQSSSFWR